MTWRRAGADRFLPFDTGEEIIDRSLVVLRRRENIVEKRTGGRSAPTTVNSLVRTREYLTGREVERLMAAARKGNRWGHRDATMILIGYRHGLRASELCDLQWSQVELSTGRLHVRRAKNGSPSVHPTQGDEIRALRRLQREQGPSSHVFMTERGGPMTPKAPDAGGPGQACLDEPIDRFVEGDHRRICPFIGDGNRNLLANFTSAIDQTLRTAGPLAQRCPNRKYLHMRRIDRHSDCMCAIASISASAAGPIHRDHNRRSTGP